MALISYHIYGAVGLTQTVPAPAPALELQIPAPGEAPKIDDIGPVTDAPPPEDIKDVPIAPSVPNDTVVTDSSPANDATGTSTSMLRDLTIPVFFSILASFMAYA